MHAKNKFKVALNIQINLKYNPEQNESRGSQEGNHILKEKKIQRGQETPRQNMLLVRQCPGGVTGIVRQSITVGTWPCLGLAFP